jgi:hypothetical protein
MADELQTRCLKSMFVRLTRELVHAGKSAGGGWSKEQLALIGVPWPPPKGWVGRLEGRRVPGSTAAAFLALKDSHRQTAEEAP